MFENPTPTQKRCLDYIQQKASSLNIVYSLDPGPLNSGLLADLWDACLQFDEGNLSKEDMADICDRLLVASRANVLQGVVHKEPANIDEYIRLFQLREGRLDMSDVRFSSVNPAHIEINWKFTSDDPEVEKLQPGLQFKFPFA